MKIIKFLINLFRIENTKITEINPYIEFINKETGLEWFKYCDGYICYVKNIYFEKIENNKLKVTKNAATLPYQTAGGPYCEWFTIDESELKKLK